MGDTWSWSHPPRSRSAAPPPPGCHPLPRRHPAPPLQSIKNFVPSHRCSTLNKVWRCRQQRQSLSRRVVRVWCVSALHRIVGGWVVGSSRIERVSKSSLLEVAHRPEPSLPIYRSRTSASACGVSPPLVPGPDAPAGSQPETAPAHTPVASNTETFPAKAFRRCQALLPVPLIHTVD